MRQIQRTGPELQPVTGQILPRIDYYTTAPGGVQRTSHMPNLPLCTGLHLQNVEIL